MEQLYTVHYCRTVWLNFGLPARLPKEAVYPDHVRIKGPQFLVEYVIPNCVTNGHHFILSAGLLYGGLEYWLPLNHHHLAYTIKTTLISFILRA